MMDINDVAPELEDGFEEESASDAITMPQDGGLLPARWGPTARDQATHAHTVSSLVVCNSLEPMV